MKRLLDQFFSWVHDQYRLRTGWYRVPLTYNGRPAGYIWARTSRAREVKDDR